MLLSRPDLRKLVLTSGTSVEMKHSRKECVKNQVNLPYRCECGGCFRFVVSVRLTKVCVSRGMVK